MIRRPDRAELMGTAMRRAALSLMLAASAIAAPPAAAQDAAPAPRPVVSEIVARDVARAREFTGVVVAATQLNLAFQTLGRMAERDVRLGDHVTAGQVLARLDQVTLDEDAAAAAAALSNAQAQLRTAQSGLDRAAELVARGVAPTERQEEAQRGLAAATAARERAEADLARARDAQGYSQLTAPMDGVVVATLIDAGAVVAAGTPVLTLAGDDGREAVIDVSDPALRHMTLGARFEVASRTGAGGGVQGAVSEIEPVADAATRTRRVHITLIDPPATMRLGSLVRAHAVGRDGPMMTLPQSAILTRGADTLVWRVAPGARGVGLIAVTLGPDAPGDRVI
ncbi:MAG: RND family efflux transporter MFP subunit, partial [Paracoccaceae bacterium]